MSKHPKKVIVLVAPGVEELELLAPVDILRRAGVSVTTLGVGSDKDLSVLGGHGVSIICDMTLDSYMATNSAVPDMVIVPGGGGGVENLSASKEATELLMTLYRELVPIAAICAAPGVVLAPLGMLDSHRVTGYPGTEKLFPASAQATDSEVVVSQNTQGQTLITSRGAGTAIPFALQLVEFLQGSEVAEEVATSIVWGV